MYFKWAWLGFDQPRRWRLVARSRLTPVSNSNRILAHRDAIGGSRSPYQKRIRENGCNCPAKRTKSIPGIYGMARRRQEIEAFVRHLVAEVEAAEATGMTAPQAIADHFNAKGVTTRKGRRWTARPWPNSSAARAPSATVRVGKRGAR